MIGEVRTCKECGAAFAAVHGRLYCSRKCERLHNQRAFRERYVSVGKMRTQRAREREVLRQRLAARDAAYAAAFPGLSTGAVRGRVSGGGRTMVKDERNGEILARFVAR